MSFLFIVIYALFLAIPALQLKLRIQRSYCLGLVISDEILFVIVDSVCKIVA